jgi:hypothetical protein
MKESNTENRTKGKREKRQKKEAAPRARLLFRWSEFSWCGGLFDPHDKGSDNRYWAILSASQTSRSPTNLPLVIPPAVVNGPAAHPKGMKMASVQQPLSMEASPSPLSSRP